MNISRIIGPQGVANIRPNTNAQGAAKTQRPVEARDEMNINATRDASAIASESAGDIRLDLVNRVRAEIQAGTYYSDEKFEIALDRMFNSFE